MNAGEKIFTTLLVILALLIVLLVVKSSYKAFIVTPNCLEQGYPKSRVTITFDGYCISPYSNLGEDNPKVIRSK